MGAAMLALKSRDAAADRADFIGFDQGDAALVRGEQLGECRRGHPPRGAAAEERKEPRELPRRLEREDPATAARFPDARAMVGLRNVIVHDYDVIDDEEAVVDRPDILIVEGLNVLQPARVREDGRTGLAVSDFFDFSVYVDAALTDIKRWYVDRFLRLRETAFRDPASYFRKYAALSHDEAVDQATRIWDSINEPNLVQNVAPTRSRANLVLRKDADHSVRYVRLRKL